MRHLRKDAGFALEELDDLPIVHAREAQLLDCHMAAPSHRLAFIGDADTSASEHSQNSVFAYDAILGALFGHGA
jgi:hypothetical protein